MKKIFTLLCICCAVIAKAGFVDSITYMGFYTKGHIDTVLTNQGIPTAVFQLKYDVKVYKVLYNTVDWDSMPIKASGLLCIPIGVTCHVPMVSYQHGTTLEKNQAPSSLAGNEWFVALVSASLGYDGIEPDYLGLGDGPGFHPYQHAHTEATATIDMIRAAREIVDSLGAPYNDQLFLLGYSQGGHATMAAHQLIQQQLDNEMHVTASAPMSGAYDMSGVMGNLLTSSQPYPAPYYLPYLLFGYNEVYHLFTNDSDVMVHPYDTELRPLYNGIASPNSVDAIMPNVPVQIMQPFQIDSFVHDSTSSSNFFRVRLKENNTYNWLPTSPLHMFFCSGDHYVPHQNATVAYNYFLGEGATNVDTFDLGNYEHQACAPYAILDAVTWFQTFKYSDIASNGVSVNPNTSIYNPNGTAFAHPVQGTDAPFTYLWSNGQTTDSVSSLAAGTYYVTVSDRSHCSYVDSAVIQFVNGIQEELLTNVRIYPNPAKGVINIENMNPGDNIKSADLYDMDGRLIKTYTIRNGVNIQLYLGQAASGIYCVRLLADSGKELHSKITLME